MVRIKITATKLSLSAFRSMTLTTTKTSPRRAKAVHLRLGALVLVLSLALAGCGKPVIQGVLSFDEGPATKKNRDRMSGRHPDPAICGDTTNGFLAELTLPGRLTAPHVPYA